MSLRVWGRRIGITSVWLGLALAVVVTRAFWAGNAELAEGDEAHQRGDSAAAILGWQRAARWYVPGAGHVGAAYERLEKLAEAAEAAGDRGTALAAWRAVRRSVLATRSVYTPHAEYLERANGHIAALMAAEEQALGIGTGTEAERRAFHADLLDRRVGPILGWALLALLGLVTWVGGALLFAWRGVGKDDRLRRGPARWAGVLVGAGLILWMLGLYRA